MQSAFTAWRYVEMADLSLLQHPHHPWKGWQEHHRIHKAKIDHFIQQLVNGENIDIDENAEES